MDRQRIGLLGGTFDPVHLGHLLLAVHSYDKLKLDRLIFIPTRLPPHKPKPRAQAGDRLKMLRLAVGEDSRFLVCDCELNRPEPSYTIDTIGQLQSSLGPDTDRICWLICAPGSRWANWSKWSVLWWSTEPVNIGRTSLAWGRRLAKSRLASSRPTRSICRPLKYARPK